MPYIKEFQNMNNIDGDIGIITENDVDSNSLNAIFTALNEAAQAASTTEFIPPKSKRLVIRPDITLPNIPGNEFSFQPM